MASTARDTGSDTPSSSSGPGPLLVKQTQIIVILNKISSFASTGLEETRDELVIKLVRMLQGEALKRIRGFVYRKKYDQRELIKVAQRQFRKYMQMRDWGWFVIIQKTRGLIGLPNPAEELALLEASF